MAMLARAERLQLLAFRDQPFGARSAVCTGQTCHQCTGKQPEARGVFWQGKAL